jgi:hypothetical protein
VTSNPRRSRESLATPAAEVPTCRRPPDHGLVTRTVCKERRLSARLDLIRRRCRRSPGGPARLPLSLTIRNRARLCRRACGGRAWTMRSASLSGGVTGRLGTVTERRPACRGSSVSRVVRRLAPIRAARFRSPCARTGERGRRSGVSGGWRRSPAPDPDWCFHAPMSSGAPDGLLRHESSLHRHLA